MKTKREMENSLFLYELTRFRLANLIWPLFFQATFKKSRLVNPNNSIIIIRRIRIRIRIRISILII